MRVPETTGGPDEHVGEEIHRAGRPFTLKVGEAIGRVLRKLQPLHRLERADAHVRARGEDAVDLVTPGDPEPACGSRANGCADEGTAPERQRASPVPVQPRTLAVRVGDVDAG